MVKWNDVSNFLKGARDNVIMPVAQIASIVPGPWQTAGKVISLAGALSSKNKSVSNPADTSAQYIQEGADAQTAYQMAALEQMQDAQQQALITTTADKQMAYDIGRGQYSANQANMLPYQQASLSSLQALPQLQQLLGLPAYNVGKTVTQYTPPDVDYLDMYRNMGDRMFPDEDEGASGSEIGSGLRASIRGGPEDYSSSGTTPTGTTREIGLTPYDGPAYDLEASPIYQFQKQAIRENLEAQLAAAGLGGGTYAQRELARQDAGLAAQERERVIGNLSSMVSMGMGGAGLGQATFTPPQMGNMADIYGQGAANVAEIYGALGAIQGQLGSQMAQNSMYGAEQQSLQKPAWQSALEMANQFGWLGGGGTKTTQSDVTSISQLPTFVQNAFSGGGTARLF